MKDTITKLRSIKVSRSKKIMQLLALAICSFFYFYFILIWSPSTYVELIGANPILDYIKLGVTCIFAIYIAVKLYVDYFKAEDPIARQLEELEMWNKFFLHFAFLKTGSSNEKNQVFEILEYLEDSELKTNLIDTYEENVSLKDAHNQIIEMYPYPQVKTFFAETEDALVKGADGNRLMRKTALNIDKYINDVTNYEKEKINSYKMSTILLSTVMILMIFVKIGFGSAFIDFANSNLGFILLLVFFIAIIKLFIAAKHRVNSPLLSFGGEDIE